jgi:hypothetical protein
MGEKDDKATRIVEIVTECNTAAKFVEIVTECGTYSCKIC